MNANERDCLEMTVGRVVRAVYEVANLLGAGFLEKVYERALVHELRLIGLTVEQQVRFPVLYKGQSVGEYIADILVEDSVLLELKCTDELKKEHLAQCLNYLKASGKHIALLQKPRVELKRIVLGLQ